MSSQPYAGGHLARGVRRVRIRPALLVIDVQNCFAAPGGSFDELGYDITPYREVLPRIAETVTWARAVKMPVLFSQAIREASGIDMLDRVHRMLPARRLERIKTRPISVRDTWDAAIVDEIAVEEEDLVVEKRRDSIFQDTELELWLRSLRIDTLVFCGLDMAICVASSLRDGFNRGRDVVLLEDATGSLRDHQKQVVSDIVRDTYGPVLPLEEFQKRLEPVEGEEGVFDLTLPA